MQQAASVRASARTFASVRAPGAYGKGVLYALTAGLALGTLGPVSNLAYDAGMGSATFAAIRATVGAAILLGFIRVAGRPTLRLDALSPRDRLLLGLTAVAQGALSLSIFAAYEAMAVAAVLAVYFCYPLVVAVVSIVLGRERLTPARGLGLAIALGGLLGVLLGDGTSGFAVSLPGVAFAGLAALCQAGYLVMARTGYSRVPSDQAAALILGGAAALIWVVAIPADIAGGAIDWLASPVAWTAVAIAGLVGAAVPKVLMLRAVRRVGGTRTSVIMLSEPIAGVALAALVLGQGLAPLQALGGAGVLVGAILAQRPAKGVRAAT